MYKIQKIILTFKLKTMVSARLFLLANKYIPVIIQAIHDPRDNPTVLVAKIKSV